MYKIVLNKYNHFVRADIFRNTWDFNSITYGTFRIERAIWKHGQNLLEIETKQNRSQLGSTNFFTIHSCFCSFLRVSLCPGPGLELLFFVSLYNAVWRYIVLIRPEKVNFLFWTSHVSFFWTPRNLSSWVACIPKGGNTWFIHSIFASVSDWVHRLSTAWDRDLLKDTIQLNRHHYVSYIAYICKNIYIHSHTHVSLHAYVFIVLL